MAVDRCRDSAANSCNGNNVPKTPSNAERKTWQEALEQRAKGEYDAWIASVESTIGSEGLILSLQVSAGQNTISSGSIYATLYYRG